MEKQFVEEKSEIAKDAIFFLILALSIALSLFLIISRASNVLPSILGFSTVKIQSSSMEETGFNVSDVAVIKKQKTNNLATGDVIAFYHFSDPFNPSPNIGTASNNALDLARERDSEIWFHEIVGEVVDNTGMMWFKTKGSSNFYPDAGYIRADLVLGKNVYSPKFITASLAFVSSTLGIILIVLLPNALLLILLCFQLFNDLEKLLYQRKITKGIIHISTAISERQNLVIALTKGQKKKISGLLTSKEQNKFSQYLT